MPRYVIFRWFLIYSACLGAYVSKPDVLLGYYMRNTFDFLPTLGARTCVANTLRYLTALAIIHAISTSLPIPKFYSSVLYTVRNA